jgi:hypothetical protein
VRIELDPESGTFELRRRYHTMTLRSPDSPRESPEAPDAGRRRTAAGAGGVDGARRLTRRRSEDADAAGRSDQPRPMNGILVAITVRNWTLASSGRLAM